MKPAPISRKPVRSGDPETDKQTRKIAKHAHMSVAERLLKELGCSICRNVMKDPLTTPCGHNFCKTCFLGAYDNQSSMRERGWGGRTLRAQKIVKKCPSCPTDICDFLEKPEINREMMDLIESLQSKAAEDASKDVEESGNGGSDEKIDDSLEENLVKEEEEEKDAENKTGNGDSDANAESPVVTIVVESKEDLKGQKLKGNDEKGDDKKTKADSTVVDKSVEEEAVKQQQMKGSEKVENKEEGGQLLQKKRKVRAEIANTDGPKRMKKTSTAAAAGPKRIKRTRADEITATDGPKKMKTSAAAAEESAVGGTPVKQSMEIDEQGTPGSSPCRVMRSMASGQYCYEDQEQWQADGGCWRCKDCRERRSAEADAIEEAEATSR